MSLTPAQLQNILPGFTEIEASNWAARLSLINFVIAIEGDRLKIQITPTPDGIHGGMGSATKTLIRLIHRVTSMGHQVIIDRDSLTIAPAAPPIPSMEELTALNPSVPDEHLMSWRAVFSRDADHVSVAIEGDGSDLRLVIKPLDQIGVLLLADANA